MQAPAGRCLNLFQATRAPKRSKNPELICSPDKDIITHLTSWLFDVFLTLMELCLVLKVASSKSSAIISKSRCRKIISL